MRFTIKKPDGTSDVVTIGRTLAIGSIIISVAVVSMAWTITFLQARHEQASTKASAANQQQQIAGAIAGNQASNNPTASPNGATDAQGNDPTLTDWLIAFFSFVAAVAGVLTWRVYVNILKTTRVAERAWVSLETLDISINPTNSRTITVGLKNSGKSPAKIITANITVRGSSYQQNGVTIDLLRLPDTPVYDPVETAPPAILVSGEISRMRETYTHAGWHGEHFTLMTAVPGQPSRLWIYGYIVYKDGVFETERRYGWAREYDHMLSIAPPAFRFRHINNPAYNYAD